MNIFKKYLLLDYEKELLLLFANAMTFAMMIIYLLLPVMLLFFFYNYIPHSILYIWLGIQLLTVLIRVSFSKLLRNNIDNQLRVKQILTALSINSIVMGVAWSSLLYFSTLYAPDVYSFILIAVFIAITSIAVITMGPVILVYLLFLHSLGISSIFFLLLQHELLYIYTAAALAIFLVSLTSGAIRNFIANRSSVLLKKELEDLNNSLEGKVFDSLKELEHKHYHDENTKLPNREKVLKDLSSEKFSALILIDIRKFKHINDLFGYQSGDELLRKFAHFLQKNLSSSETLYKFSGNEFIIASNSNEEHINDIAKIVQKKLRDKIFQLTKEEFEVAIEVVISIVINESNILEKANLALNYAKENKIPIINYTKHLHLESVYGNYVKWSKIIKDCIKHDDIVPVYQPIVSRSGEVKYEVLMRLRHNGELITPYFFLDIAKKTHYYLEMTKTIIQKSFLFLQNRNESFSINLSYEDIQSEELIQFLIDNIKYYDIASRLVVEIIESEEISDYNQLHKVLSQLRSLGVKLAIDDFGTGYSNFSYILELEPDFIKIDGSLVKNLDTDIKSYLTVQAIARFSETLGIKLICEFIHSKEVLQKAQDLEVEYFQGYYFSEPLEANKLDTIDIKNKL